MQGIKKRILTDLLRRAYYICIYYSIFINITTDMAKKRKLNSQNPKYWPKSKTEGPKIKKCIHSCDAAIRNIAGNKTGKTSTVYAVYLED